MARPDDKNKAIKLRLKGYSYSQIKNTLGISKSTLSGWLAPYPLSEERLIELKDDPKRVERYRNTMAQKRADRLDLVYKKVEKDIGKLTDREIFITGLFLYWGEGFKADNCTTSISNTDPKVIKFFLKWLYLMGIDKKDIFFKLQLYSDMNVENEISFWLEQLGLPKSCLRGCRIKESRLIDLTYKNGFGHGTCNLGVYNRDTKEYITTSLRYIKDNI
jgi:hypothetical protein